MARNYAAFLHEYLEEMEELTDAEFGRLARALLRYSSTGQTTALSGNERFYAKRIYMQEDRFRLNYDEAVEARSNAGKRGASKRWKPKDAEEADTADGNAINGNGKNSNAINANSKNGNAINRNGKNGKTETETETKTETKTEINILSAGADNIARAGEEAPPPPLRNPEIASVMRLYMDRINPTPSRLCVDELAEFAQTLGAEACIHAMQVALDEKKTQWSYIRAILRGYQSDGVRCLADIQAREERRQQAKKEPKERNSQYQKHCGPLSERAKQAVQMALAEAEEDANG